MASTLIIALVYIISIALNDEKMKVWVKSELWNLVMNILLAIILISVVKLFLDEATSASNMIAFFSPVVGQSLSGVYTGGCLYEIAYNYSLMMLTDALKLTAVFAWMNLHLMFLTEIQTSACSASSDFFPIVGAFFCMLGAPTVSTAPYAYANWAQGMIGNNYSNILLTTVFVFAFSQAVLIKLFLSSGILVFLAGLGLLKLFPFTKAFANAAFAVIFAFMIFFPLVIVLEAPIFGTNTGIENILKNGHDVKEATELSNVEYGSLGEAMRYLVVTPNQIWTLSGDRTTNEICIKHYGDKLFCLEDAMSAYIKLLFKVVLFGSINFIIIQLVVKTLLSLAGQSDNLMEMFIRMGGVISW